MPTPSDRLDSSDNIKIIDALHQPDDTSTSENNSEGVAKTAESGASCVTGVTLIKGELNKNQESEKDAIVLISSNDLIYKSEKNTVDASLNGDDDKSKSNECKTVCDTLNLLERETKVKVKIKKADLSIIDYELCLNDTVDELKQKLAHIVNIPAEYQRIVTSGRVLKNDCTVQSCGIINDQILFVLNNKPKDLVPKNDTCENNAIPVALASGTTTASSGSSISTTVTSSSVSYLCANTLSSATTPLRGANASTALGPSGPSYPNLMPFNLFGGDMGSLHNMNSGASNDMMNQLLNAPFMQDIMENPEFLSYLLEANPQLNELRRQNPELNHILNDPQMLRQSMELMRNPALMREMMRSSDRALSNIEAVPGGFNALRRMYHTIQEPMWNATVDGNPLISPPSTQESSMYDLKTDEPPNTEAVPNPWAQQSTSSMTSLNSHDPNRILNMTSSTNLQATNNQNLQRMGFDPNSFSSILSNPFLQNFVNQNLPGNQGANAQSSSWAPFLSSAFQSSASSGGFSPLIPSSASPLQPSNNNNQNLIGRENPLLELPAMMNAMQNMNLNGQLPNLLQEPPRLSNENPEVQYHSQLYALRNMGFTDTQACIRALQEANGNINNAIDRLLSEPNNS